MRRASAERRILAAALVLSAALHTAVFNLQFTVTAAPRARDAAAYDASAATVMRVYDLVIAAEPAVVAAVQVQELAVAGDAVAELQDIASVAAARAPVAARSSSLRLRMGDGRLWTPPAATSPSEPDAVRNAAARIQRELKAFEDSLAAEADAKRRGADWTTRDSSGGRWGISPGSIHLGKTTIAPCKILLDPFTCEFRVADGRREDLAKRLNTFTEMQLQVNRITAANTIDERARALRARADARRDSIRR